LRPLPRNCPNLLARNEEARYRAYLTRGHAAAPKLPPSRRHPIKLKVSGKPPNALQ
jgi:hypothetical protein